MVEQMAGFWIWKILEYLCKRLENGLDDAPKDNANVDVYHEPAMEA